MADGKVEYEVRADTSKLGSDLSNATKTIETESKKWGKAGSESAGTIDKSFDALIKKAADLGAAFGRLVVQFLEQGVALAETVKDLDGTLSNTFGEAGTKRIENFTKRATKQFGLSELQVKKMATLFGILGKNTEMSGENIAAFSEGVIGLSADLAAFIPGADVDQTFNAIRSAFNGKPTALKNLGIDLSAGTMNQYAVGRGFKSFKDLSSELQFSLMYAALQEQAKNLGAVGAFSSSRGSVQNAEARIGAYLENSQLAAGEKLLPLKEAATNALADVLEWASGAPPEIKGSKEELQTLLTELQTNFAGLNEAVSDAVKGIGEKYGLTQEMYNENPEYFQNAGYDSYGDWVVSELIKKARNSRGEGQQEALKELETLQPAIESMEAYREAIYNVQEQLNYLEQFDTSGVEQTGIDTGKALVDGLNSELSELESTMDAYLAELNRLNGVTVSGATNSGVVINGTHANGLDYVPFNNYLAKLHEGESVLTAEEAKVWRDFKYGGLSTGNTVNYDALGVTMRENVRAGGNVFLDGEIVGRVISSQQGDSYRAMERSGFQQ